MGASAPLLFASRTLSKSERNYTQLEKEALSLVFGIKRFHQYLHGRKFTLVTDHKPLTAILRPKNGILPLAAARLQRWAVLFSAYRYDIIYKSTQVHANANGLSRLPLPSTTKEGDAPAASILNLKQIDNLPVTNSQLEAATQKDPTLSKVWTFICQGWPQDFPKELKYFSSISSQLTVEGWIIEYVYCA